MATLVRSARVLDFEKMLPLLLDQASLQAAQACTLLPIVKSFCFPDFDSPSVFARILDKDKLSLLED